MPLDLTTNKVHLRNIQIFENEKQFYFIGTHSLNKTVLIFTINKLRFTHNNTGNLRLSDTLIEHKFEYDKQSLDELFLALSKHPETNLRLIEEVKCIFGFVKFYFGYYAILVTDFSKVGKIGDFIINRVERLKMLPLFLVSSTNAYLELENKYLTIFKNFDPSKQIYFSFTYDITKTLQRNFLENFKKDSTGKVYSNKDENSESEQYQYYDFNSNLYKSTKSMPDTKFSLCLKNITNNTFLWNHFHIKEFFNILENKIWVTYFIYGFFEQIECMNYGLRFLVTVIARRNRKYAGTRYLKRGINDDGNVANDVETEQILEEISTSCPEKPVISSYVHIRGSVPISWYQEQNSILPKPDIKLNYSDVFYTTTKKHFNLLIRRYGRPVIVCNLTKKKEGEHKQEELLNDSYSSGIDYINSLSTSDEDKITYLHYDLKNERRQAKFYRYFYEISYKLIEKTKMFTFIPNLRNKSIYLLELQSGIIRSNCVDCLDRTNVFQQVIGSAVMVNQLREFGINAKEPNHEEEMFGILTELYKHMGHELSSQYAGSLAHKQTIKDNRNMMNKIIGKFPEFFNTFKRYFNNSFNDHYKQASMNLFLGKYRPREHVYHLWDMISDVMLHKKDKISVLNSNWATEAFNYYQRYNLISDLYPEIKVNAEVSKGNPVSILNYISIEQNRTNEYFINLEKLPHYKNLVKYIKTAKEVDSFYFLDIDHKTQIKNFYGFSYQSFLNFSKCNDCKENSGFKCKESNCNNNDWTIIDNNDKNYDLNKSNDVNESRSEDDTHGWRYKTKESKTTKRTDSLLHHSRSIKKKQAEWSSYKKNEENIFYLNPVEKPKFEMKITSFEIDANEINITNEFVDPDPKYLQNSEYHRLDYFLSMEINIENYTKIFDEIVFDGSNDGEPCNEFVDDFLQKFNMCKPKKKQQKLKKLMNEDYLIYIVEEKQFYKKLRRDIEEAIEIKNTSTSKLREDSPKIKVKVKKLPIKIFEEYII